MKDESQDFITPTFVASRGKVRCIEHPSTDPNLVELVEAYLFGTRKKPCEICHVIPCICEITEEDYEYGEPDEK